MNNIAVVGAGGVTGRELLQILEEREFPISQLQLFGREGSVGRTVKFQDKEYIISPIDDLSFEDVDIAFFCAGKEAAHAYIPKAIEKEVFVIDLSDAFRMHEEVPLIVPEVNAEIMDLETSPLIASPNCVATLMLAALAPLELTGFHIESVQAVSMQAVSGAGQAGTEELHDSITYSMGKHPFTPNVFPHSIGYNLFHHESPLDENGFAGEETKIIQEVRKVLQLDDLPLSIRSFRVPVERAHTISMRVVFSETVDLEQIFKLYNQVIGVKLYPFGQTPTPQMAANNDYVHVGGLRNDLSDPNAIEMVVAGDQLRKGAALNAVQIAELISQAFDETEKLELAGEGAMDTQQFFAQEDEDEEGED
ncbi:MAG: Aspartate-semialdehyde dehydrogenase 2 [Chlamydiia bacterium]|nr:Aspartate-semialdehyde dehydrogenase 2 [Chlamydiia bacterium]